MASVYHLRAEGNDIFYAMEFVAGETVEAYVRRRGPLPSRLALRIILQAAQGLAAAHERSLIHRDIKPANLMLAQAPAPVSEGIEHEEEDGLLVKVIDFGLAKSVSGSESGGGLTGGNVVGTPQFMSPEQISAEAGRMLDCRTDIYSLGVTLWYLLAGRPPFEGSQFEILSQQIQKRPPLEKLTALGVPVGVVTLIGSMLSKDREERPGNYPALISALKKLLRSGGATTSAVAALAAGQSTADDTMLLPRRTGENPLPRARSLGLVPILVATAVGALVIGGLMLRRTSEAPTLAATQPEPAALSEATKLANRARETLDKVGYTREDLGVAEDLSRRATELEPTSSSAWSARAVIQSVYILRYWDTSEKRRQDTEAFAIRALALNPDDTAALTALSRVLMLQGAAKAAEAYLRRAVALRPDDNVLRRSLSHALAAQGLRDEAMAELVEASRRNPRDPLVPYDMSIQILDGEEPDFVLALKYADASLAIQTSTSAHLHRIRPLAAMGDLAGMRAELDKIRPSERGEERALYVAMWVGLLEGKLERVLEASALTAKSYLEDVPSAGPKAWLLALAYTQAGKENLAGVQWQDAEGVLRQKLRDNPSNLVMRGRLAVTLAWLVRAEEAPREMVPVEAAAMESSDPILARQVANYYAALGDAAKAAPWIRRSLRFRFWSTGALLPLDPFFLKLHGQPEFEALVQEFKPRNAASGTCGFASPPSSGTLRLHSVARRPNDPCPPRPPDFPHFFLRTLKAQACAG